MAIIDPLVLLEHSLAHLDFIRSQACTVANGDCKDPVVPAHLRPVGKGNNRSKPSLRHLITVPLCGAHHGEQEGKTHEFNEKYNVDLAEYAFQLLIESISGLEACFHNDKGIRR